MDSFKPVYVFENGSPGQGYYRVALLIGVVSFVVWAARQPTEFDGFLQAQKEFVDDLYSGEPRLLFLLLTSSSGNLLTDYSQSAKDTIDRNKRVPDLEDLLRQIELDEIAAEATKAHKPTDTSDRECDGDGEECSQQDSDSEEFNMPDFDEEGEEE